MLKLYFCGNFVNRPCTRALSPCNPGQLLVRGLVMLLSQPPRSFAGGQCLRGTISLVPAQRHSCSETGILIWTARHSDLGHARLAADNACSPLVPLLWRRSPPHVLHLEPVTLWKYPNVSSKVGGEAHGRQKAIHAVGENGERGWKGAFQHFKVRRAQTKVTNVRITCHLGSTYLKSCFCSKYTWKI